MAKRNETVTVTENFDVSGLGIAEMQSLIETLESAIEAAKQEQREKVRQMAIEMAQAEGLDINEIFGKKRAANGVVKFRDPENPENTWTGLGRRPQWLNEKLDSGVYELQDFSIV